MAMGWLKGLVAPAAFGDGSGQQQQGGLQGMPGMQQPGMQQPGMQQQPYMQQPGMQQPGGPPIGGMPPQGGSPYGVAPPGMPPPGMPPIGAPGGPAPYNQAQLPNAMQWSTGTRSQGGGGVAMAGPLGTTPAIGATSGAASATGAASPEDRIAQLQHDVDSLALFARTLLTMLEENRVVTREQFDATKNRLDMLDGKLDDR